MHRILSEAGRARIRDCENEFRADVRRGKRRACFLFTRTSIWVIYRPSSVRVRIARHGGRPQSMPHSPRSLHQHCECDDMTSATQPRPATRGDGRRARAPPVRWSLPRRPMVRRANASRKHVSRAVDYCDSAGRFLGSPFDALTVDPPSCDIVAMISLPASDSRSHLGE